MRNLLILLAAIALIPTTAASSRVANMTTVENAIQEADLLVYGEAVEAATIPGPGQTWPDNIGRQIVQFRVDHVLKGDSPESADIEVNLPVYTSKARIFDGPEYETLKTGVYSILALVPDKDHGGFRFATREWTYDNEGFAYPAVEGLTFGDIPAASPALKFAHSLVASVREAPADAAMEAVAILRRELNQQRAFSPPAIRTHLRDAFMEMFLNGTVAVQWLGEDMPDFTRPEYNRDAWASTLAGIVLCHLGETRSATQVLSLIDNEKDRRSQEALQGILHLMEKTSPPWLCDRAYENCRNATGWNRQMLLVTLVNHCRSDRVMDELVKASREEDMQYSIQQALAQPRLELGPRHRQQIRGSALEVFQTSENPSYRSSAARTLGNLGDPSVVPALAEVLSTTHDFGNIQGYDIPPPQIQDAAIRAIAQLRGMEAIPLLIKSLDIPTWQVRRTAISELSDLTGRELDYNIHVSGDPELEQRAVKDWQDWWAEQEQGTTLK